MSMVIDGTSGLTFNNATTQASGSKVLQVVNATYATQTSSTTTSFVDTGLTATITPLFNTSKILCIVDQSGVYKGTSNTAVQLKLLRNSTSILFWETYAGNTSTTAENGVGSSSCTYLDSPATTSAITYKTQLASYSGTASAVVQALSAISTITLLEIAA